ncbi:MAG: DUF4160 domain-containing protein [Proteobacteria bacterium]|nr:DUF4160 domain-containing protein [Pseudomonadota bacterium]
MPEISRFFGIVIYMHFNEHNPPHFHAKYAKHEALICINDFKILNGSLPPKALSLVIEWAGAHKKELLENWNELRQRHYPKKIKPLE